MQSVVASADRCLSPSIRARLVKEVADSPTTNAAHILAMVGASDWSAQTLTGPAKVESPIQAFSPSNAPAGARRRAMTIGGGGGTSGQPQQPYFDGSGMFPMQTLTWLAAMKDEEVSVAQSLFELSAGVSAPPAPLRDESVPGLSQLLNLSSMNPHPMSPAAGSGAALTRSRSERDLMDSLQAMRSVAMPWSFKDDQQGFQSTGEDDSFDAGTGVGEGTNHTNGRQKKSALRRNSSSSVGKKKSPTFDESADQDYYKAAGKRNKPEWGSHSHTAAGGELGCDAHVAYRRQRSRSLPFLVRGDGSGPGVITGISSNSNSATYAAAAAAAASAADQDHTSGSDSFSEDSSSQHSRDSRGGRARSGSSSGGSSSLYPMVSTGCAGFKQKDDPLSLALRKYHYLGARKNVAGYIGIYAPEDRKIRIARFLEKRKHRVWNKKVKYDVRKNFADSRVRVKGRFVKKEDMLKQKEEEDEAAEAAEQNAGKECGGGSHSLEGLTSFELTPTDADTTLDDATSPYDCSAGVAEVSVDDSYCIGGQPLEVEA